MATLRLTVKVEAVILKYARRYSGLTLEQTAQKTKISLEKLREYEENGGDIPMHHLEKISDAYKRTLAFFFLLKVPDDAVEPKSFRLVYSSETDLQFSPAAYLAIRRGRYVQSVIADFSEKEIIYDFPSVSIKDNVEDLSKWLREFVGIAYDKQKKWANSSEALREWKNALEVKNIFVIQHSLPKEKISAFSLADKKPYVIVLNSSEHENRRVFSLFHELGHILLHQSGICTPDDLSRNSYQYTQVEKFCNQLAASLLLPKIMFDADIGIQQLAKTSFQSWNQDEVGNIARKFKVSKEVVVRRFLTLGYIEEKDYDSWHKKWQKITEEFKAQPKKTIKIPQYIKCISKNGRGFTSFVLDQYHASRITFSAAADILNIKPKYISQLETKLK